VLTWVDCFNFLNNSTNEDVVLDNVRVTDSLGTVIVSGDTDGDGIPDAWEMLHYRRTSSVQTEDPRRC